MSCFLLKELQSVFFLKIHKQFQQHFGSQQENFTLFQRKTRKFLLKNSWIRRFGICEKYVTNMLLEKSQFNVIQSKVLLLVTFSNCLLKPYLAIIDQLLFCPCFIHFPDKIKISLFTWETFFNFVVFFINGCSSFQFFHCQIIHLFYVFLRHYFDWTKQICL